MKSLHTRNFLRYIAMYKAKTFDEAIAKAEQLVADGGYGHTSSLYINVNERKRWKNMQQL